MLRYRCVIRVGGGESKLSRGNLGMHARCLAARIAV